MTALRPSAGTQIPTDVRIAVRARDLWCVCDRAGFPAEVQERCHANYTEPEIDHVHGAGLGKKGPSTPNNLVLLSGWCHRWKTEHGREARALLDAYLAKVEHTHVEPVNGCAECRAVFG